MAKIVIKSDLDFDFAMQNIKAIAIQMQELGVKSIQISKYGKLPLEYMVDQLLTQNESDVLQVGNKQIDKLIGFFVFKLDLDGIYKDVIVADCLRDRLWGFSPDEFIGRYMESILPTEIAKTRRIYFQKAVYGQSSVSYRQSVLGDRKLVSIYPDIDEVTIVVCDEM